MGQNLAISISVIRFLLQDLKNQLRGLIMIVSVQSDRLRFHFLEAINALMKVDTKVNIFYLQFHITLSIIKCFIKQY